MASLNKNEKNLLIVLGAAVFLTLNAAGFFFYNEIMTGLNGKQADLLRRQSVLTGASERLAEADGKKLWLNEHLMTPASLDVQEKYLDIFVRNVQTESGLDIVKGQPGETRDEEHYRKSSYDAVVRGKWRNIMNFVYRLQKPGDMRFVPSIGLKAKKNEGTDKEQDVECEFRIEKWWSLDSAPEEPAAADPLADGKIEQPAGAEVINNPDKVVPPSPPTTLPSP